MKQRLDKTLFERKLVGSRSSAESYIKLGYVLVNGKVVLQPSYLVGTSDELQVTLQDRYVSRAGMKLASVAQKLGLDFKDKIVLDVGSSTGGFTDYALQNGATKVIAVDVGTDQLHPSLHGNPQIELHEQTDIRNVTNIEVPDIVVIDVSFISLREILPHISLIVNRSSLIVAMVKPQFEAGKHQVNKGVIKNDRVRRDILKDFEFWVQETYSILDKADSEVAGAKGNLERFYVLQKAAK